MGFKLIKGNLTSTRLILRGYGFSGLIGQGCRSMGHGIIGSGVIGFWVSSMVRF